MNEIIKAIRTDSVVGNGTCSPVDETLTDAELEEVLRENGADRSIKDALVYTRNLHELWGSQRKDIQSFRDEY